MKAKFVQSLLIFFCLFQVSLIFLFWRGKCNDSRKNHQDEAALHLEVVTDRIQSFLWRGYIHRYHSLGYKPLPVAQLRYTAMSNGDVLALLRFGAAAWKTAPRDNFIGWNHQQRQKNLHLLLNNARFLILPWVKS